MIHIKVITLRQLIGIIAAIVVVLALAVFAVCSFAADNKPSDLSAAVVSCEPQAEDISAYAGQALPIRSDDTTQPSYLSHKLPHLIHLVFGFDPTDTMSIFAHAMPGAAIAEDAIIEGLDTARIQNGTLPQVTVRFEEDTQGIGMTLRNRLFSAYRTNADKRVFIYHSHTTEAYADSAATTSAWRSRDDSQNMIGVGDALCDQLEALSITVSHDRTYHENPNYNYAYSHSLQNLQTEYENHPDTDIFIDVHRDAWIEGASRARAVQVEGRSCAQLQFVIGKGNENLASPYFAQNAALAEAITDALEEIAPGITIPVRYVNSRYNQHVAQGCILVEVGHNENTLAEAHLAMKYLAHAISIVLSQS